MKWMQGLLLFLVVGGFTQAEIYKWVDDKGNVHYTDKKPASDDTETLKAQSGGSLRLVDRKLLVGSWIGAKETLEANFSLANDGSFKGAVKEGNQTAWIFSGNWTLSGNQLTWNYMSSIPRLPDNKKRDVNVILKLDDQELVPRESNGRTTRYERGQ